MIPKLFLASRIRLGPIRRQSRRQHFLVKLGKSLALIICLEFTSSTHSGHKQAYRDHQYRKTPNHNQNHGFLFSSYYGRRNLANLSGCLGICGELNNITREERVTASLVSRMCGRKASQEVEHHDQSSSFLHDRAKDLYSRCGRSASQRFV